MSFEQSWAETILRGFAPGLTGDAARAREPVDYRRAVRMFLHRGTFLAGLGLRLAVWMVWLSPLWAGFQARTFGGLSPHARSETLGRLLGHRLFAVREFMLLLKLVAGMALMRSERVRAESHYDDFTHDEGPVARSGERPKAHLRIVRTGEGGT